MSPAKTQPFTTIQNRPPKMRPECKTDDSITITSPAARQAPESQRPKDAESQPDAHARMSPNNPKRNPVIMISTRPFDEFGMEREGTLIF
jgi:hypothetical protein